MSIVGLESLCEECIIQRYRIEKEYLRHWPELSLGLHHSIASFMLLSMWNKAIINYITHFNWLDLWDFIRVVPYGQLYVKRYSPVNDIFEV